MADQTAERMLRTARRPPYSDDPKERVAAPKPDPFTKAPKSFPRRVTLDLTDADYDALREGAYHDRSSIAEILRCLVELWRTDPKLAAEVTRHYNR